MCMCNCSMFFMVRENTWKLVKFLYVSLTFDPGFFNKEIPLQYPSTGIDEKTLTHIGEQFSTNPDDLTLHGGQFTSCPLQFFSCLTCCSYRVRSRLERQAMASSDTLDGAPWCVLETLSAHNLLIAICDNFQLGDHNCKVLCLQIALLGIKIKTTQC